MIKNQFLLIIALLCTAAGYSQKELSKDYSYTISDPYKVFDGQKFYFSENGQVMTVKTGGRKVLIQKLDSSADKIKFLKDKIYDDFPGNMQFEEVLEFNGRYYFFYSSWDGGDVNKEQLFAREIDFASGEFKDKGKLLFKVDGKVTGSPLMTTAYGFTIGVQDKFDFLQSLDDKKMLIQYRKKPEVKRDKISHDIIGMNSFDENMTMTSANEIEMPYTERRMDNLDYVIDGDGTMYILAKVYHDDSNKDKKRNKDEEANYHVELLRIKSGSKDIDITKVEVKDTFLKGLWLYESPDNYMVCAGFYNDGERKNRASVDGLVVFKIGKDGSVSDLTTHEIPVEVLNEYIPEKKQRKNNKKDAKGEAVFEHLLLRQLVINKDDGSLVLIGEKKYVVEHVTQRSVYYTYHYEDLLITKITPSGELAWMKKIPKIQKGSNGLGGMSYKYMFANGNHHLLFLDNVKNHNLPLNVNPARHTDGKGGYFTSYKIDDATGTAVNSSVFNVREMDDMTLYQFGTDRIVKTSENSFAVEFYKKKKEDVMVKVEMK